MGAGVFKAIKKKNCRPQVRIYAENRKKNKTFSSPITPPIPYDTHRIPENVLHRDPRVGQIAQTVHGVSPQISMTTICRGEEFDSRALGG